jgi:hypothetical protein
MALSGIRYVWNFRYRKREADPGGIRMRIAGCPVCFRHGFCMLNRKFQSHCCLVTFDSEIVFLVVAVLMYPSQCYPYKLYYMEGCKSQ